MRYQAVKLTGKSYTNNPHEVDREAMNRINELASQGYRIVSSVPHDQYGAIVFMEKK